MVQNFRDAWGSPCGGGVHGAKAASSSTRTHLGRPHLLRGGMFFFFKKNETIVYIRIRDRQMTER